MWAVRTRYTISLRDHLGSASTLLDASGNLVTNGDQRYYPFGESRITNADLKTDHLFTGQLSVGLGGIYHYGARMYSPRLGRFLSADTVVPNPANPQSLNRYSYVYNNPLKYVDPTGHETCYDTGVEIGSGISQADCWAYGRDRFIRGWDVDAPQAGEGYSGPNSGNVYALVEIWLEALEKRGGTLGTELAQFYRALDTVYKCSPGRPGRCVPDLGKHRINIIVADTGVAMQTDINTNTIIIAPGILVLQRDFVLLRDFAYYNETLRFTLMGEPFS